MLINLKLIELRFLRKINRHLISTLIYSTASFTGAISVFTLARFLMNERKQTGELECDTFWF